MKISEKNKKLNFIYPLAYMLVSQSIPALVIGLAIFGKSHIAADISVAHGATIATFFAFSANFRHIILYGKGNLSLSEILYFRLIIIVPLAISTFALCALANIDSSFALVIIIRRCVEWINEVHICDSEVKKNEKFALFLFVIQVSLILLTILLSLISFRYCIIGLWIWAIMPVFTSIKFIITTKTPNIKELKRTVSTLLPHFGSTSIMGICVYLYRFLIVIFAGKLIAGDLLAAFAIGGFIGTFFSNIIGPSIALHESEINNKYRPKIIILFLGFIFITGVVITLLSFFEFRLLEITRKSYLFWLTLGLSMIGSLIMIKAQLLKIELLKFYENADIFGPDMLIHILLIASIPCLYFINGINALSALFLIYPIISYIFYLTTKRDKDTFISSLGDYKIRCIIIFSLLIPVFFQLSGRLYLNHISQLAYSSDSIIYLPLPVSILSCYLGLLFIGNYKRAYVSLVTIFFLFFLMIVTTIIITNYKLIDINEKLLLLFQFILPYFALVLGQLFENGFKHIIEKVFLYTILLIVPFQLIFSWISESYRIKPILFFLSVYQQYDYVTFVLVCCFLIAFTSLWRYTFYRKILLFLSPIISIYSIAGLSLLSVLLMFLTFSFFSIYRLYMNNDKSTLMATLFILIVSISYSNVSFIDDQKELTDNSEKISISLEKSIDLRIINWSSYISLITDNNKDFLLGHNQQLKNENPNARFTYNYYLDLIYNFGFISFLPFLFLILWMLHLSYSKRSLIFNSEKLLGLSIIVFFLIFVDNNLNGSFRQPYSGILSFFLCGVYINRLIYIKNDFVLVRE